MDQLYHHIMLVTDGLESSNSATETAFNLAKQHKALVTIVDAIREPSGLSRWLSANASDVFEMVMADKQKRLAGIASQFYEAGLEATSEILVGKSSEVITRAVIEKKVDLVVRVMKGPRSRFPGLFGNTSRNLMRVCPCPVLLVNRKPLENIAALACVNVEHDVAENESILRHAEQIAFDTDRLSGIYCWNLRGTEIMQGHMTADSIEQLMQESERVHRNLFEKAIGELNLGKLEGKIRMENGDPVDVIPRFCRDEKIDVVVMCSASLNHPIQRYLGSTIESVLDELPCSLLVVKPRGFESPVRLSATATDASS